MDGLEKNPRTQPSDPPGRASQQPVATRIYDLFAPLQESDLQFAPKDAQQQLAQELAEQQHVPTNERQQRVQEHIEQQFDAKQVEQQLVQENTWEQLTQNKKLLSMPPAISPWRETLHVFWDDWRTRASVVVLGLFVVLSLLVPPIYQRIGGPYKSNVDGVTYTSVAYHGYSHEELDRQDELPSGQYWLGTDQLGRDILARLMQGMLISLFLAIGVAIVDFGLGLLIGLLAAYYGGIIDQLLARFTDLIFAFPGLLFLIMAAGIFGPQMDDIFDKVPLLGMGSGRAVIIFLALALFVWPGTARLVRGQALQLKEQQFVEAARTSGTTTRDIIWRHIAPNLINIVIFSVVLDMAGTIEGEAGISLLGIGIQPPGSSIGLMIADASPNLLAHPWEMLIPTLVLTIIVLAFAFGGDAFQDAFDPYGKKQKI